MENNTCKNEIGKRPLRTYSFEVRVIDRVGLNSQTYWKLKYKMYMCDKYMYMYDNSGKFLR
jgi:hypothetical protein